MAGSLARIPPAAEILITHFWPGPLTVVLDRRPDAPVAELATAGLPTIALRAPAHATAQALIATLGRPVVAPSANRSGHVSPTTAAHVAADLKDAVAVILDAGPCAVGIESTVVLSPGQLLRHYAPGKPLRLDATTAEVDEFLIGFGPVAGEVTLSARGDLTEAAARLFALLREAEASPKPRIAVAPIPARGLGRAIRDRLERAAREEKPAGSTGQGKKR